MSYTDAGVRHRAFHTEGIGDSSSWTDERAVIFLYASHDGVQQLVGAAANARCLIDRPEERESLVKRLQIQTFWRDAWNIPSVRAAHQNDENTFMISWNADLNWIPNWTCRASMFFQPAEPITLDPVRIRGTSKLLTMFGQYTTVDAATSMRVLRSVPHRLRDQSWTNLAQFIAQTGELAEDSADDLDDLRADPNLVETTKQALIAARRGQGRFRKQVSERWGGICAVNGCTHDAVLRASHIKPWWASSNQERLDPANGILLTANLDALFDRGFISFDKDGNMLVSDRILQEDQVLLGLPKRLRRKPTSDEKAFLKYHRKQLFCG